MDLAHKASLSITNSQSLLKLMSSESVMPPNHLIFCCPLFPLPSIFPSGSFPMSQFFTSSGQNIGASASASVLPVNIQDWFLLGLTGLISLQSNLLTLGIEFSSVAQLCLTLWDRMDCSMPGLPVHHQLLELTQTHVHQVGDGIQPSHPLLSPSPPIFNLSQH